MKVFYRRPSLQITPSWHFNLCNESCRLILMLQPGSVEKKIMYIIYWTLKYVTCCNSYMIMVAYFIYGLFFNLQKTHLLHIYAMLAADFCQVVMVTCQQLPYWFNLEKVVKVLTMSKHEHMKITCKLAWLFL